MSSSGSGGARPQRSQRSAPAEQHLGDRLAAFVDGELTDDSRDRVLAHLATCPQCKAAAAEQRRLKKVVAGSELPAISAGLLARLQGLPGMAAGEDFPRDFPGDFPGGHPGGFAGEPVTPAAEGGESAAEARRRGPFDGGLLGSGAGLFGEVGAGVRGGGPGRREEFSFLGPARDLLAPTALRSRGFRIHELRDIRPGRDAPQPARPDGAVTPLAPARGRGAGRTGREADRAAAAALAGGATAVPGGPGTAGSASASRGRRFAFAAAGAFSLAAIAIGGALPMEAAVDGSARPDDGPAVSPLSATSSTVSDTTRGVTPRGVLDAADRPSRRHAPAGAAAASATSVALTRPLLGAGAVPVSTASAVPVPVPPAVAAHGGQAVLH